MNKQDVVWIRSCINIIAHLGSTVTTEWEDVYVEVVDIMEAKGLSKSTYFTNVSNLMMRRFNRKHPGLYVLASFY